MVLWLYGWKLWHRWLILWSDLLFSQCLTHSFPHIQYHLVFRTEVTKSWLRSRIATHASNFCWIKCTLTKFLCLRISDLRYTISCCKFLSSISMNNIFTIIIIVITTIVVILTIVFKFLNFILIFALIVTFVDVVLLIK